jgi:hypothetical protein
MVVPVWAIGCPAAISTASFAGHYGLENGTLAAPDEVDSVLDEPAPVREHVLAKIGVPAAERDPSAAGTRAAHVIQPRSHRARSVSYAGWRAGRHGPAVTPCRP